ncbi:MAG: thiamine pyrophosphate-requiring protein [Alphaproteobacteria bacterium]|nr:thiamine pyrophosphate-requiring protein [Alphaproteobacteria bacterium]
MTDHRDTQPIAADVLLARLRANDVSYFFANAGTDFAPIVESLARARQAGAKTIEPIICGHENAAVSMAHGVAMVTGQPQAVMVHVNVGTANALCGLMNAEREQIPMLFMAGRTPIVEDGLPGNRTLNIHWAQEMFDQNGIAREAVRWDYELRHGSQTGAIVDRALAIAKSPPRGPVYLALPREILASTVDGSAISDPPSMAPRDLGAPNPAAIDAAAAILSRAENPLIVTASAGRDPAAVDALAGFADRHAIPVVEFRPRYLNLPATHPMHWGYEVGPHIEAADAVLVLDCDVPWIPALAAPKPGTPIIQVGADPLFARYPLRGFPSTVTIAAEIAAALDALSSQIDRRDSEVERRRNRLTAKHDELRAAAASGLRPADGGVTTFAWATRCLADAAGQNATFVSEYPLVRSAIDIDRPGGFFGSSPAGGLGWGLPAALGAKLAEPDRLVVAALGDGSYIFSNPAACHQISANYGLPVLTVVFNNEAWMAVERATRAMYPDGAAARENRFPLSRLAPSPDFEQFCEACGGWGARVDDPDALPGVLEKAVDVVEGEGRQALVNILCR